MKRPSDHEIEGLLRTKRATPPSDLLARLCDEIPNVPKRRDGIVSRRTIVRLAWAAALAGMVVVPAWWHLGVDPASLPPSPAAAPRPSQETGLRRDADATDTDNRTDTDSDAVARSRVQASRVEPVTPAPAPRARNDLARRRDDAQPVAEQWRVDPGYQGGFGGGAYETPESVTVTGESPLIERTLELRDSSTVVVRDGLVLDPNVPPSTGGTAEPNDAVYDRVYFQHYGTNPFVDTEDDPLSTFGLDVDTASYTLVRRFLQDGNLPSPEAVRVEEVVNFFDYGDAAPRGDDFAIHMEAAPTPFTGTARTATLRIGIRARDVDPEERKPVVLTFLVDVSGSMNRENRLGLVKRSLGLLLEALRPDDRVGLVVFGTGARKVLEPTTDHPALRRAIEGLSTGGSTNMEEGLRIAYTSAREHLREDAVNRVILCSDGVANVGDTGWERLLENVSEQRAAGIELTTVGFGMGNYNDVLMEQLADNGNGGYAYVDTIREAKRVFVEELAGTLETVARDAKVQVAFDPALVASYRLIGYENRDVRDEDFRNDAIDAGEIGLGHHVTALYEVKLREGARTGSFAEVRLRYHSVSANDVSELERRLELESLASRWEEASPSLKLAAIAAELAELLRGSYWAKDGSLDDLFVEAQSVLPEFPGRTDVAELVSLIGRAKDLSSAAEPR